MADSDPIVVTGMGAVSPLGVGVDANWQALMAGRSGTVVNTRFDTTEFACKIAGLVPGKEQPDGFDPTRVIDPKDIKKMDLFIQYGLGAAAEALAQSGWVADTPEKQAVTGTIIGSGVGGSPVMAEAVNIINDKGPRRLSPFTVPSFLANLAAGWISIKYGFKGPIGAPVTACAASAQAIGDAMRLIRTGEAEVMVCGGAEGSVDPISIGGFAASRALDTSHNDTPTEASRPFDKGHAGFVLSEGAAVIVIEKLSHALARGATPLAIAAGYGTSADAYHLTAGSPDGAGAQVAMNQAIRSAGLRPDDIGYVNAHATSTEVGDNAEINGIRAVFGDRGQSLAVSSTKSATGHMLGAAGAIEAVFSILALRHQMLPPTLNLHDPEEVAKQFDLVPLEAKPKTLKHALSNSFGFGGVNASLVFSAV
ncbi:MAG: beta-ketoacyl-[acyl-carrier-protein] synthase II [Devosia sp. 67-54]|uniref:beta-ketoacyl-ACP synthase II n=1 Tax=unclassified Devosia TaxID=196773 RepID=UPI0009599D56|nr:MULTISPECIES: beta-ketoacyl-ACP synthase II [unclassified Devosia]MBN9306346.1 beta-ketoacyl-ACP synthase II [Devosia sp.]OJX18413.1 MAG: beta-ketoacyl-[acyl-carrier-protein] synthase II [Devosia sp. 67-54]